MTRPSSNSELPTFPKPSEEDVDASLQAALEQSRKHGNLWVFGYGSLMWNPAITFLERRPARVYGWRRRFCLASTGRGTNSFPGAMLALDWGGSCVGVVFRIAPATVEDDLRRLWDREMLTGAYRALWLDARIAEGHVRALAFVADRKHPRFIGHLDEAEIAYRIAYAVGPLGSCRDYLFRTMLAMRATGQYDTGLERLKARVDQLVVVNDARPRESI